MTYKATHEGRTYKLFAEDTACCLFEEGKLVYWGEISRIPEGAIPLEVLLDFSIQCTRR